MREGLISSINKKMQNTPEHIVSGRETFTFSERVEKAINNTDEILENANMVQITNNLIKEYPLAEIENIPEEVLEKFCDPYDAAVIVALAKKIAEKKKSAN